MAENTGSENVRLKDESSIPAVIEHMSLWEKSAMCAGRLTFETFGVERLGVPKLVMADGHNGVNIFHLFHNYLSHSLESIGQEPKQARELDRQIRHGGGKALMALLKAEWKDSQTGSFLEKLLPKHEKLLTALSEELKKEIPEAGLPTCFPTGIVAGATWDPELAFEYGRAVAKESKAFGMDIMLGPNVNIHRDPLCGRVFESYSEDPFLTARIGVGYIQGVQDEDVAAVVKHFVANNQEHERLGGEQKISERALREIYLPAFQAAIQEGGSWMVMSAYNRVNGEACCLSRRLLTDILRGEWGFKGFVVSDWGAAYDRVAALQAGNDLEMPGPLDPEQIVLAVRRGELQESVLDERVANILRITLKLPAFMGTERPELDRAYSTDVARRLAADGMVLLKNESGALPCAQGRIALFGGNAREPIATGTGSAGVVSPYVVSVEEALEARYGESNITFDSLDEAADLAVVCVGVGSGEGSDREHMRIRESDVELIKRVAADCRQKGMKTAVVLNVCAPVELADWIDDVDAVLLTWMAGMEMGHAVADVLSGDVNPSGKLPLTFPRRYNDAPTALTFRGEFSETVYGEDIFVGYRYYDTAGVEPIYEFGHGLSYTTFELSGLELSADTLDLDGEDSLTVTVDIVNTGKVGGKEVVQLYIHDVRSSVRKAEKELKGFEKVGLDAGEKKTLTFIIGRDALSHYDSRRQKWCVEPGRFEVLVGTSSRDIRVRAEFRAAGYNPYAYGMSTPVGRIMCDAKARTILLRYLPEEALNDPTMKDMVELTPLVSWEAAWREHLAQHLGDQSQEEMEIIREKILAEFSSIEVD